MQNLLLAFEVVFPLFFIIAGGFAVSRLGWLSHETCKQMNRVVFRLCMPFLIFSNLYFADVSQIGDPMFILTAVALTLLTFTGSYLAVTHTVQGEKRRGALIHALFRTNFLIFALPIVEALFGSDGLSLASILIVVIVPLYNVLAVCVLERFRGGKVDKKRLMIQIATNPFIYAALLGLVVKALHIPVYAGMEAVIEDVASVATPLILFLLGAEFDFSSARHNAKTIAVAVFGRLVLIPAILMPICVLMGFRGVQLAILMALVSTPCAVASYTMSLQMGGDGELAGQLVVFSTIFSSITLVFWIFLFKQLGFF